MEGVEDIPGDPAPFGDFEGQFGEDGMDGVPESSAAGTSFMRQRFQNSRRHPLSHVHEQESPVDRISLNKDPTDNLGLDVWR